MDTPSSRLFAPRVLGRTGLMVGPLGLSATYGVPTAAVERAVDAGMNYLYWGSFRRPAFAQAIRNLARQRDRIVLVIQSYSPLASGISWALERGLRRLGREYADVLLLGMWNRPLPERIRARCRKLRERGLVRHIGISTHNRSLIAPMAGDPDIDVFHVRYSAVHTGAERDVFPHLPADTPPGIVSFTATSQKQLLGHRRIPRGERVPTAGDCYRFVLSHPAVDVCMSGPATEAHVDEALAAIRRGSMDEDDLAWMRRVGRAIYAK
jgi:aryl-alcohol dehydrogenase-like predicted oxidoreductase